MEPKLLKIEVSQPNEAGRMAVTVWTLVGVKDDSSGATYKQHHCGWVDLTPRELGPGE